MAGIAGMTLPEIKELITFAREQGVLSMKLNGVEIVLGAGGIPHGLKPQDFEQELTPEEEKEQAERLLFMSADNT